MPHSQSSKIGKRESALSTLKFLLAPGRPPDVRAWQALLAEDIHLRICARPVAIGREDALTELAIFFRKVLTFGTGFHYFWLASDSDMILVESDIVTTTASKFLPIAIIFRVVKIEAKFQDVRFYFDPTPLSMPDRLDAAKTVA